ncbi:MAG TPA: hypothetical protein DCL54_15965 [Alphaproteobacteria bacterium]|nr:hypothetical protein [Alphaproteobacteria bacterium]HAJ48069.1 hypothetical protein [Alphaproteobacteria bacterium]
MLEQGIILAAMLGTILVLSLIAWWLFRAPRPKVPDEGPIRIAVRPIRDLQPDPQHLYLGDGMARDLVAALQRYDRVEAHVSEGPARFVLDGSVKITGPRLAMALNVTSYDRQFWKGGGDALLKDVPALQQKTIDSLARTLKVAAKKP